MQDVVGPNADEQLDPLERLRRALLGADAINWDGTTYVVGPYDAAWYAALSASRRSALLAAAEAVSASRTRLSELLRQSLRDG
jgi:hypothetical protein